MSALEFLSALFFVATFWPMLSRADDGMRQGLLIFAIACGLAGTGLFLLWRHLWAYLLSVVLALGLSVLGSKILFDFLVRPRPQHGGPGLGLELGLAFGVPGLLALIALLLPPTWREVGLGAHRL